MATYRTLAKKVRSSMTTGSGANDVYVPIWFAFDAIDRFVRGTTKKLPSLNSEEAGNEMFEDDVSAEEIQCNQESGENVVSQTSSQIEKTSERAACSMENVREKSTCAKLLPQTPPNAPKIKRTRTIRQGDVVNKHLKHASEVLGTLRGRQQPRQVDPDSCTLYGQLLAAKLRKLSKRTQLILQNKIDNLVFEAELNELQYSSLPVSSQFSGSPNFTLSPNSPDVVEETVSTYYVSATDLLNLSTNNDDEGINK